MEIKWFSFTPFVRQISFEFLFSRSPQKNILELCTIMSAYIVDIYFFSSIVDSILTRASDRSRKEKSNFVGFLGTNSRKNWPISREFCGSFLGKLHQKAIGKKQPILWLFSRQILLEIDRFCADQTRICYVFLTEDIICSFNNNTFQK